MAGRGAGPRHTLVEQQPVVMSDCACKNGRGMGRETELELATGAVDEDNLSILVIKDNCSKTIGATFVQAKGADPFAVKYSASFLQRMGHSDVTNNSDGYHSITMCRENGDQVHPRGVSTRGIQKQRSN